MKFSVEQRFWANIRIPVRNTLVYHPDDYADCAVYTISVYVTIFRKRFKLFSYGKQVTDNISLGAKEKQLKIEQSLLRVRSK